MPSQSKISTWKQVFLQNKELDLSDNYLKRIKKASNHQAVFAKSFEAISKNDGIAFLTLDPTESHLQLLHHGNVLGGNWANPTKKMVAILGLNDEAKPIQLVKKSVKNVKENSFSFEELASIFDPMDETNKLGSPDQEFLYKNILPILNSLTKIFVNLKSTEPFVVAKAFIESVGDSKSQSAQHSQEQKTKQNEEVKDESDKDSSDSSIQILPDQEQQLDSKIPLSADDVLYAVQFCQLCSIGKFPR
jgi:hypothetical protein